MAEDKITVCLELSKARPSQFLNYNFKSYCRFGNYMLGANEDGIFVLDGADKDGTDEIVSFFRIASTDFGLPNLKRLRKVLMGYRTDGVLEVAVSADGREDVAREVAPSSVDLREHSQKVPIGRDVKGRYLEIEVRNVKGSDFTVDSIYAVPIVIGTKPEEGV